ncbi:MAG: pitrilysin family protein [Sediminibacterium sp.]|nr:pitrilysin family protein [Sediminibacterium sp.]
MIKIEKFVLKNGLTVLVQEDKTTPMAVVNVLYKVGAKHENKNKTGFAHLFEHLMFSGSINIPEYDSPLQKVGGENNAFTSNDYTNFYAQLPAENIETAFWLESDRMLSLAFNEKNFLTQKKVVCEEFKENYINKPYGDIWHIMRKLAFKQHPYKWMTIGSELAHIENATLEDAKDFFYHFYRPNNAIISVVGNITIKQIETLANKWFGDIPANILTPVLYPTEPKQTNKQFIEKKAKVPIDYIVKAWHIEERLHPNFYTMDLITDIMGSGDSARLYQSLIKENPLFNTINCYHLGAIDPSLFVITGKINKGVSMKEAENGIINEIEILKNKEISETEIKKISNRIETIHSFENMQIMNRAHNMAYFEMLDILDEIDHELEKYQFITNKQVQKYAQETFIETNENTLYYYAE